MNRVLLVIILFGFNLLANSSTFRTVGLREGGYFGLAFPRNEDGQLNRSELIVTRYSSRGTTEEIWTVTKNDHQFYTANLVVSPSGQLNLFALEAWSGRYGTDHSIRGYILRSASKVEEVFSSFEYMQGVPRNLLVSVEPGTPRRFLLLVECKDRPIPRSNLDLGYPREYKTRKLFRVNEGTTERGAPFYSIQRESPLSPSQTSAINNIQWIKVDSMNLLQDGSHLFMLGRMLSAGRTRLNEGLLGVVIPLENTTAHFFTARPNLITHQNAARNGYLFHFSDQFGQLVLFLIENHRNEISIREYGMELPWHGNLLQAPRFVFRKKISVDDLPFYRFVGAVNHNDSYGNLGRNSIALNGTLEWDALNLEIHVAGVLGNTLIEKISPPSFCARMMQLFRR